eukprot:PhF_6_TR13421/c0_g2_i19/m.21396
MKLYFHNIESLGYCHTLSPQTVGGNPLPVDVLPTSVLKNEVSSKSSKWILLLAVSALLVYIFRMTPQGNRIKTLVKTHWGTLFRLLLLAIIITFTWLSDGNDEEPTVETKPTEDRAKMKSYFPEPKPFLLPSDLDAVQTQMYRQYRCLRPVTHGVEASNTFPVIGPLLRDIVTMSGAQKAAFLDIGSNDGQEVALYMKMLHKCSQCHIVSVEPNINYTMVIQQKVEKRWDVHGPAVTLCRGAVTNERNPHADNEELYLVGEGVFAHIVP